MNRVPLTKAMKLIVITQSGLSPPSLAHYSEVLPELFSKISAYIMIRVSETLHSSKFLYRNAIFLLSFDPS
jgi:hypothetical protein